MRQFRLPAAAALLATSVTMAIMTPPAQAAAYPYGSFAYSPSHHSIFAAGGGATATAAEAAAISNCTRKGPHDCIPVAWFKRAYGAFAVGTGGWGWGSNGTQAGANSNALNQCSNHGGTHCRILLTHATAAPSQSDQTYSNLIGRVCLTFAPKGAITLGHVGWAVLVNRDTGSWFFGANEGDGHLTAGFPSRTWYRTGNWTSLLKIFISNLGQGRHKAYFHASGYYKTYRCESFGISDPGNAQSVAGSQQGANYRIPFNDCLSNAVDVLRADGATNLPSYVTDPVPKDYYNKLPGFEEARPL